MWSASWPRLEVEEGVVSNYRDEKLHQPPLQIYSPPPILHPFRKGLLRTLLDICTIKRQMQIGPWGLIIDEVSVSVYREDQTIDCRSAAGSFASYRGEHLQYKMPGFWGFYYPLTVGEGIPK